MKKDNLQKSFDEWNKRIDGKYIKAICKPCWEMKYCPYGSLVEYFPVGESSEPETCLIFGHICPAFFVAEPFTETKELRNISRYIPNAVRRKVDRRDGNICSICKMNIDDSEVNYDHIIPWSKGGATTESNLRVVCSACNKKRGNDFENQYLVSNAYEWRYTSKKLSDSMVEDLLSLFFVALTIKELEGDVTEELFCNVVTNGDMDTDRFMYSIITGIMDIFESDKFFIPIKKKENLLRYRWGLIDKEIHSIEEVCEKYKVQENYYIEQEILLLRQMGFLIDVKERERYIMFKLNSFEVGAAVVVKLENYKANKIR